LPGQSRRLGGPYLAQGEGPRPRRGGARGGEGAALMSPRAPAFRRERRRRGFVLAAMHSPSTWPLLAGSLVASVAFGIHLGESSIGLINPIYFQAPPLH